MQRTEREIVPWRRVTDIQRVKTCEQCGLPIKWGAAVRRILAIHNPRQGGFLEAQFEHADGCPQ